ncbi:MAG: hypothetical protein KDK78_05965 [Chlamydiia bacterium]|nr:hypothetical protein [Chlamydiia bacterium]
MHALDHELFLGLLLDTDRQSLLDRQNPHLVAAFISEDPCYLQKQSFKGQTAIGRALGLTSSLEEIQLAIPNVLSLLARVFGDHAPTESDLQLIAVPKTNAAT